MTSFLTGRLLARARLGAPLAAALLAAACASSGGSPAGDVPLGAIGGVTPSPGQVVETVISTRPAQAGTFLTDGTGRTVYLWARDGWDRSACSGACAAAWPPVQAKGKLFAAGGAHAGDLGTIAGPAGSEQVTYAGHALYYNLGDAGPGQTAGQGSDAFGGRWWLVAPTGTTLAGGT